MTIIKREEEMTHDSPRYILRYGPVTVAPAPPQQLRDAAHMLSKLALCNEGVKQRGDVRASWVGWSGSARREALQALELAEG